MIYHNDIVIYSFPGESCNSPCRLGTTALLQKPQRVLDLAIKPVSIVYLAVLLIRAPAPFFMPFTSVRFTIVPEYNYKFPMFLSVAKYLSLGLIHVVSALLLEVMIEIS